MSKNVFEGSCLARPIETQASVSTGFHKDSKAKLNQLLTLEKVLEQYEELVFENPEDVSLSGQFVMDLVDEINAKLNRHLESKVRLTCNNVLMTNFDTMTNLKHWLKSKLFQDLPKKECKLLKEKIAEMVDLLKALWLKIDNVDATFKDQFLERMKKRCKKYRATDYDLWKVRQSCLTMERLTEYQAELTADMLIKGILKYDDKPHGEEMDGVDLQKLRKKLKNRKDLPEHFDEECAKLRRYSHWEGDMFMIDYQLLRNYIYRVFRLLTNEQRIAMFYYEVQMKQIHEDMKWAMEQELVRTPDSTVTDQSAGNQPEAGEKLSLFIHPSLDDEEGWKIHNELKRLARRQSLADIIKHLRKLESKNIVLMPIVSSVAYDELVRLGMPDTGGFSKEHFRKQYFRKDLCQ